MSAEVQVQRSVPLEELFMIGVTPFQQDRVMTPSRAKSAKGDKMKVSNQCKLSEACLEWVFMGKSEELGYRILCWYLIQQLCRYMYHFVRIENHEHQYFVII